MAGSELLRALVGASAEDLTAWRRLVDRVGAVTLAGWLAPPALLAAMLADTELLAAMLESLRDDDPSGTPPVLAALPEVAALAAPMPPQVEHDAGTDRPLLDHIATRLLGRKLRGLETRDIRRFQDAGLAQAAFDALADRCARVMAAGLGPPLRAAIAHLDIAKTSAPHLRALWSAQGVSIEVHNEAAAAILRRADRARAWPMAEVLGKLAISWIEAHGLAGQHVRGEGPLAMFAPLVATLREIAPALARVLGVPPGNAVELALDALHVLDACDTGACREGLLDDALLANLAGVRDRLRDACRPPAWSDPARALAAPMPDRAGLAARLRALRSGRQRAGEPAAEVDAAIAAVSDADLDVLAKGLANCQVWYAEAATGGLSPAAQLGVLAAAVGAACRLRVDVARPWHAQLRPLVARLHDAAGARPGVRHSDAASPTSPTDAERAKPVARPSDASSSSNPTDPLRAKSGARPADASLSPSQTDPAAAVRYRRRLVEAALAAAPIGELLAGAKGLGPLGTLSARLAHPTDHDAIVFDYVDTDESAALVTLLALYETRSQAAFHTMLKALCDLYGLRKDEFDRVANEANYLAAMNAARSDKERMLDFVVPGRIVEIGPGGGIVLDLLARRYPDSDVIGVDLSREVVAALALRRAPWKIVHGSADDLPSLVATPVDTVVFCSILHEVYSYAAPPFSLVAVERAVRAAFTTLRAGGRLVIRDGVMPPPGRRRIRMLAADVRPTLDLYVAQFEGRPITFVELAPDRVEMSTADAMEFLYTYTWGPASFPYEVREQYGILPYDDYVAHLIAWCGGPTAARAIDTPLRSYLQPGYRDNLAGVIELTDEHDAPVELPDSNCLIVIEKR